MTKLSLREDRYLAAFHSLEGSDFQADPPWLKDLRRNAISRFGALGFPTNRRGNEEWKYTNAGPIANMSFDPIGKVVGGTISPSQLSLMSLRGSHENLIVFVDGNYSEPLSSGGTLPSGVIFMDMADAFGHESDLLPKHVGSLASVDDRAFTALNTAFFRHGAFIHVPKGLTIDEPIQILFISTDKAENMVFHPRILIVAGVASKATFIESYFSVSDVPYFTNQVTEVVAEAGSRVNYYKIQRQSEKAFHVSTTHSLLAADSTFNSTNTDLGGALVRNNLDVLLDEEGGFCRLNGLYLVTGSQHVDNQVIIDHAKPYTNSQELYKGVLAQKARSVFHGSITVRPGAKKVNANQVDKNLLLSDQAEAFTKPAFWIYCDDVKCGHGAACGQIDENALFYMRSRGIGEKEARRLLIEAFVDDVIDGVDSMRIRAHLDTLILEKLKKLTETLG